MMTKLWLLSYATDKGTMQGRRQRGSQ